MKKTYIAPTVILTKCQLEGFITASNQGGTAVVPGDKGSGTDIDPSGDGDGNNQKSKWNTGWESDWDTDWED